MTNSFKKAIVKISKPRDETHRRRERHRVKQELNIDPFTDVVHFDPKELGKDEWGTWLGLEYEDPDEKGKCPRTDYQEVQRKMRRK